MNRRLIVHVVNRAWHFAFKGAAACTSAGATIGLIHYLVLMVLAAVFKAQSVLGPVSYHPLWDVNSSPLLSSVVIVFQAVFVGVLVGATLGWVSGFFAYGVAGVITARLPKTSRFFESAKTRVGKRSLWVSALGALSCSSSTLFVLALFKIPLLDPQTESFGLFVLSYTFGALGGFALSLIGEAIATAFACLQPPHVTPSDRTQPEMSY